MIDLLLNKHDPRNIVRSSSDFAGLNIILEQIAQWLSAEDGYLSENELLSKVVNYLTERGIRENAADLIHHFEDVGILERIGEDVSLDTVPSDRTLSLDTPPEIKTLCRSFSTILQLSNTEKSSRSYAICRERMRTF